VDGAFDFAGFCDAVEICVGALNDVLDEGLPIIRWKNSAKARQTGGRSVWGFLDWPTCISNWA
jgi:hypothetical protein